MKLIRFGPTDLEKPGLILSDGRYIDVSDVIPDYDESFFTSGQIQELKDYVDSGADFVEVDPSTRLGPPLARPSKLICIGLNYAQHAKETGAEIPKEPVIFFKSTSSICGPNDDVLIPPGSIKTDYEVELAFIIGKKGSYIPLEQVDEYIFGYCLHNDYSERAYQLERGGQWVKGKSCDHFAPLGPFILTSDEMPDPQNLTLWTKLNGEMVQNSTTADMVYNIRFLVHYLSQFMSLLPGDVISTGTPFGVGMGRNPQRFVHQGDIIEIGVDLLGSSRQIARNVVLLP
ncbi:MAG: fumarylacetoacetate hydrolase family protein [Saprospiraceae bacterium]|jgi:2-keto-4-pentenoate hydratase/2-oxohepta-3-ene-1,7-dioic acid hydratase in catechol pathway|nr:fumarylacetoacetate hydrolase family protein [Saprospiraceae bacterium]MBK6476759.1 fumarylacetoacetate hydrolase family protein [Saprospiraceae bacterium]MBK6816218.1 fumarylacetoacetate hydrolase family protein [Saprospiraceae bacterium]MBK7370328.1 fumarylacetoacetate hydrolase family protein [Saprospiraceae bacterium]MBK7438037.1 fumarylacetoacetate hydrolase family protein [Saprospiraceae bacterium]